jgi:hypothetical protein
VTSVARRKLTVLDDPLGASEPAGSRASARPVAPRDSADALTAVFVRVPASQADELARAAFELRLHKQEIVAALLAAHVDARSEGGLAKVHELVKSYRDGQS